MDNMKFCILFGISDKTLFCRVMSLSDFEEQLVSATRITPLTQFETWRKFCQDMKVHIALKLGFDLFWQDNVPF